MGCFFVVVVVVLDSGLHLWQKWKSIILTAFFDFDKWVIKFKAGLIVPITGFAHSVQSSALDYKTDKIIDGDTKSIVDRYHSQLDYYADAVKTILGKEVKEKILYLFDGDCELYV